MEILHKIIKSRREKLGYSLDYISVELGVSSSTISRWENGHIDMRITDLVRYAEVLGWSKEDLIAQLAKENPRVALKTFFIKVYTEEGYKRLLSLLGESGQEHIDFEL